MSNSRDNSAQIASFRPERQNWLRLRTLILLRWMAIFGQLMAIAVASLRLGFQLPIGLCIAAVGLSVIANLIAIFIFPRNRRLNESEALLALVFDLAQLSFLLYLTGGLTNPFAVLIIAPVTVSAAALELRSTVLLGALAAAFSTLIGLVNLPLVYSDGSLFNIPWLFAFGFWLSLIIGIAFLGTFLHRISSEIDSMSDALLATQMALAREQKLTDLGGVVAAAAHELGTPLATIKMVSTELIDELGDFPELAEDARLIREQADRCRDILRSMGKAGKDDLQLRQAPLSAVVSEAAEPHIARGIRVIFSVKPQAGQNEKEPLILRRPELIHGLRNLVQNAVDFAKSTVWVEAEFSADHIQLRISDDGEGFPNQVIGRIGDPFVRSRRDEQEQSSRPGYEGMGLGLFIAKTLLERTGAELSFANGTNPFLQPDEHPDRRGAIVLVIWPTSVIVAAPSGGLGENQMITG